MTNIQLATDNGQVPNIQWQTVNKITTCKQGATVVTGRRLENGQIDLAYGTGASQTAPAAVG